MSDLVPGGAEPWRRAEAPISTQVQAYRFGLRRRDAALLRGDPLSAADPYRPTKLALCCGVVLAALAVVAVVVVAVIRPQPTLRDATLVLDRATGALYVVRDGTLYPTLNLASALLIVGARSSGSGPGRRPAVTVLDPAELRRHPRGPVLGIPGAPSFVPHPADLLANRWSACDQLAGTDSAAGQHPRVRHTVVYLDVEAGPALPPGRAVLVHAGAAKYLVFDGHRHALVDDPAVRRALALDDPAAGPVGARPISAGLLAAIPAGADIRPAVIADAGRRPTYDLLGLAIGAVVRVEVAAGPKYYVLRADGVQSVTRTTADLVRYSNASSDQHIPTASPERLAAVPMSSAEPLIRLPEVMPTRDSAAVDPVLCLSWDGRRPVASRYVLSDRPTLPAVGAARPVPVVNPGGADEVVVAPGHGAIVAAVNGPDQPLTAAPLSLITDTGQRYPVPSVAVVAMLGLDGRAVATPEALVAMLPVGPVLDPAAAARAWPATSPGGSVLAPPPSPASG